MRFEEKSYPLAQQTFTKVIKEYPGSDVLADAYRMSGECALALKDFAGAREAFGAASSAKGASPELIADAVFQEGWTLYKMNRFATRQGSFRSL